MVGGTRRSRVILQVRMRGIHRRNPADHHLHIKCTSHLGFSLDTPAGGVHPVLRGILSGEITEFEVWADRTNMTPERQSNDFEAVVEEITVLFRGIQAALESAGEQDLTGKSALARLRSYDRDDQRTPVGLLDGVFARRWGEHMGHIRELREALGV